MTFTLGRFTRDHMTQTDPLHQKLTDVQMSCTLSQSAAVDALISSFLGGLFDLLNPPAPLQSEKEQAAHFQQSVGPSLYGSQGLS